jgi:hypothetical protein
MGNRTRWFTFAGSGLLIIGAGVSFIGEATGRKIRGEHWFTTGTIGLVLLNAGLSLFGDAIKERTLLDMQQE